VSFAPWARAIRTAQVATGSASPHCRTSASTWVTATLLIARIGAPLPEPLGSAVANAARHFFDGPDDEQ